MTEPLAYRAEEVPRVFPIGRTLLFQKIKSGEIESFKVGRARFIARQSLVDFMNRQIAEQNGADASAAPSTTPTAPSSGPVQPPPSSAPTASAASATPTPTQPAGRR